MAKVSKEREEVTERLEMRVSPGFLRLLDEWRRREEDIPSRSEAARRLIVEAIKAKRRK
jgi:hypothetical protein